MNYDYQGYLKDQMSRTFLVLPSDAEFCLRERWGGEWLAFIIVTGLYGTSLLDEHAIPTKILLQKTKQMLYQTSTVNCWCREMRTGSGSPGQR